MFLGVTITALGGIGLVQLTSVNDLSARNAPGIREWYPILALVVGFGIMVGSLVAGLVRWPTRPRYTGFGILMGLWAAYPGLLSGIAELTHPLGYFIVLGTPVAVAYVVWRDASYVIRLTVQDPIARWFGIGVGLIVAIFFMFSTGMLTVVPDEGVGLSWTHNIVATTNITGPLVLWPALEFWFPHIPFGGAVSVGMTVMIVVLSSLVGLNAGFAAYQWGINTSVDSSQTVSGAVALTGPNACCCCGPVLSQFAVVLLGPSAAAPLYWVFVDIASPVGGFFFVASIALLTGSLVYAARSLFGEADDDPNTVTF